MSGERILGLIALVATFVLLGAMYFVGEAQENQSRLATARGQGTLRVGDERFKINSVIVKLIEDRKAEITLVSDITVFMEATWTNHGESRDEFDLEVTGGASPGGVEGRGKVFLSSDGKAVMRLSVKGVSRTTKRIVEANFEGK
jgi:hypothetical protein